MSDNHFIEAYRSNGRFVSTPSGTLFLIDCGDGSPVLFLHGIPSYSFLWRDVLPVVALDHREIVPDLLGFGLSEKHRAWDYSVATQADAIRSLLLQIEIERVAIVCHDFGALVAAELISRVPDLCTELVILNTSLRQRAWGGGLSPLSVLSIPIVGELAMSLSQRWMLKVAMDVYVTRKSRLTADVMRHYWWPFEHGFKETLLIMSRNQPATETDFERWRTALAQIKIPSLIIWGQDDPTFTVDEAHDLSALMPHARLQVFEHANHFVPEDRPIATGRLIDAFLAGIL